MAAIGGPSSDFDSQIQLEQSVMWLRKVTHLQGCQNPF